MYSWPLFLDLSLRVYSVFQTIESSPHGKGDDGEDVTLSQLVITRLMLILLLYMKPYRTSLLRSVFRCLSVANILILGSMQHLIDLAGSESSKTEITGQRRKEGSSINKSLLTLGTVRKFFFSITFTLLNLSVCKLLISIYRLYLN